MGVLLSLATQSAAVLLNFLKKSDNPNKFRNFASDTRQSHPL